MLRILKAAGIPIAPVDFRVGNVARMTSRFRRTPSEHCKRSTCSTSTRTRCSSRATASAPHARRTLQHRLLGVGAAGVPRRVGARVRPARRGVGAIGVLSAGHRGQVAGAGAARAASVEAPPQRPIAHAFGLRPTRSVLRDVRRLQRARAKNPLGVVEAFRAAFPAREPVRLFLKISNLEYQPDLKSRLEARAGGCAHHAHRRLSRAADLWALMASIDCFVSLHRAEGFGLGMAEAMACGKAVIATAWSGNVDFTRPENAMLVDYPWLRCSATSVRIGAAKSGRSPISTCGGRDASNRGVTRIAGAAGRAREGDGGPRVVPRGDCAHVAVSHRADRPMRPDVQLVRT